MFEGCRHCFVACAASGVRQPAQQPVYLKPFFSLVHRRYKTYISSLLSPASCINNCSRPESPSQSAFRFIAQEWYSQCFWVMAKSKASSGKGGNKSASTSENSGGATKLKACNYVKCRHILCEKQSKNLEALGKIQMGERFDAVATQYSEDKARQGGDLGWKGRQDVVGAFADAAFALDIGQMTASPIKTQFGYHLILVEGRKASL